MSNDVVAALKGLSLHGMAGAWPEVLGTARMKSLDHEALMHQLLKAESAYQFARCINTDASNRVTGGRPALSLRGAQRRGSPATEVVHTLDCRASLAMTSQRLPMTSQKARDDESKGQR